MTTSRGDSARRRRTKRSIAPSTVFAIRGPTVPGAGATREMLRRAMRAYVEDDAGEAHRVAEENDRIDELYRHVFGEMLPLSAAHNLERIADRVTKIAERIIFSSSGEMEELNPEPGDAHLFSQGELPPPYEELGHVEAQGRHCRPCAST